MKTNRLAKLTTGLVSSSRSNHKGIQRALQFIAAHHHRPIQVRDLHSVAGLSRRGLMKAFERQLGRGPGEILRELRINRAKQLLQSQKLELGELAGLCGYRRANSLWVAFRRLTGMTPHQYRERMKSVQKLRVGPVEQPELAA